MSALEPALLERAEVKARPEVASAGAMLRAPSPNPPGATRVLRPRGCWARSARRARSHVIAARNHAPPHSPASRPPAPVGTGAERAYRHCPRQHSEWERRPLQRRHHRRRIHGRGACAMKGRLAPLTLPPQSACARTSCGRLTYPAVSTRRPSDLGGARYCSSIHRDLLLGDWPAPGERLRRMRPLRREDRPTGSPSRLRTRGAHGAYTHARASETKIAGKVDAGTRGLRRAESRNRTIRSPCSEIPPLDGPGDGGIEASALAAIHAIKISMGRIPAAEMNMIKGVVSLEVRLRPAHRASQGRGRRHVARLMAQFPTRVEEL